MSEDQKKVQRQMEFINKDGSMRSLVVYMRVSQEEQSDLSLEAQFSVMVDFCVSRQIEIAGIYWDKKSGKNYIRPGFRRMIKDMLGGNLDGMLVVRMDRFGRNWFAGICILWVAWLKDRPLYFPEYDCFPVQVQPAAMGIPGARLKAVSMLDQAEARNKNKASQIRTSNGKAWMRGLIPNGWAGRLPFVEVVSDGGKRKKKQQWAELGPNARQQWDEIQVCLTNNPTWSEFRNLARRLNLGEPRSLLRYLRMHYVLGTWSDPSMQWVCPEPWGTGPLVSDDEWNSLQDLLDKVELDRAEQAEARATKPSTYELMVQETSITVVAGNIRKIKTKHYCEADHELSYKTKQSKGHDWADWMSCSECKKGYLLLSKAQQNRIAREFEKGHGWSILTGLAALVPKCFRSDPSLANLIADILLNCGVEKDDVKRWLRRSLRSSRKSERVKRPVGNGSSNLGDFR